MLNAVLNNLINIGWAMLIFLCAYLSNVAFPFTTTSRFASALRQTENDQFRAEGCHLRCGPDLALCSNHHPSDLCGSAWVGNPGRIHRNFADLVIVGAVLMVSCKYIAEAFTKFRAILQVKGDTENE